MAADAVNWTWVGSMPEAAIYPTLEFHDDANKRCILIKQRQRRDLDYYFEFNIDTNECIKKQMESTIDKSRDEYMSKLSKLTATEYDNIGMSIGDEEVEYSLNFLKEHDEWYTVLLSIDTDALEPNFPFILFEDRYIIIFTKIIDNKHDIWICDMKNLELYVCNICLPEPYQKCDGWTLMSSIIIPKFDNNTLLDILSYFVRKHCDERTVKLFPNDIYGLIIQYYASYNLYIFGGIVDENMGSDKIYKTDIYDLLDNKRLYRNINKIVNVEDIKFVDNVTNETYCWWCYEPADYIFIPCMHVCAHYHCLEYVGTDFMESQCTYCGQICNELGYVLMS